MSEGGLGHLSQGLMRKSPNPPSADTFCLKGPAILLLGPSQRFFQVWLEEELQTGRLD